MDSFMAGLGEEIDDVDEETFNLFSSSNSSQDLGMIDAEADELELSVCGRDFTIKQSPGVLQSNRAGGTTGAAVWRVCVHFSEWIETNTNPIFTEGIIDSNSVVLELGTGISGLVPSMLSTRVKRVIATDQEYALKLLRENLSANQLKIKSKKSHSKTDGSSQSTNNIDVTPLDWEQDDINAFLRSHSIESGVDAIIVCDCIFNYALIQPLVQTCVEICTARQNNEDDDQSDVQPTLCIIAQQLRQPEVFESWLQAFMKSYHVWRLPNSMLTTVLSGTSGFVVHVGILRRPDR